MAASNRTIFIACATFAAGIAGTVLVGALASRDRPAEIARQASDRPWSDPVKAQATTADATARPRLRFQPDDAAGTRVAARAAAPMPVPPARPSSLDASARTQPQPVDEADAPTGSIRRPIARERLADAPRGEIRIAPRPAGERLAERPAREPKQRMSSVEAGGVMQWLMERR